MRQKKKKDVRLQVSRYSRNITVPTSGLTPGMILGQTVRLGNTSLSEGTVLDEGLVTAIRGAGMSSIAIREKVKGYKQVRQDLDRRLDGMRNTLARENRLASSLDDPAALRAHALAVDTLSAMPEDVRTGRGLRDKGIRESVGSIVEGALSNRYALLNLVGIETQDAYTYVHSVGVCTLSVVIGSVLGLPKKDLLLLGVGALLHDTGKALVPDKILNKPGPLTPEEWEIMRGHPMKGYEMLQAHGMHQEIQSIAFQHHERVNGDGYPLGVTAARIRPFAKVVAIADVYDALTTKRVYKDKIMPYNAMRTIMKGSGTHFDPSLVRIFMQTLGIYPVGSMVRLNNGRSARVIAQNETAPVRPIIELFKKGSAEIEGTIDLLHDDKLFVADLTDSAPEVPLL